MAEMQFLQEQKTALAGDGHQRLMERISLIINISEM